MMKSTLPRPLACLKQALVIAPALALLALPAAAQLLNNFDCTPEEECHVAPYFHGGGGFVGQALAGSASRGIVVCGSTSSEFSYTPGTNGRVAEAITPDACPAGNNGVLVIRGLEDGGWYYMNDTTSSAVAPLIPLTVLSDPARSHAPYDPGGLTLATAPSISINGQTLSDIGTFFKHESTGRVGLLPHVAATRRSPTCGDTLPGGSAPLENECYLDAVYTAQISVDDGGVTSVYQSGETITRKGPGGGDLTLVPNVDAAGNVQTDVMFDEYTGGAPTVTGDNVHQIGAAAGAMSTVDIAPADGSGERCEASNPDRGTALPVKWTFAHANIAGDAPIITDDLEVEIMVACPPVASSSHQGVDLVPDPQPSDG